MLLPVLVLAFLGCANCAASSYRTVDASGDVRYRTLSDCPPCSASKRSVLQYAVESYWRNDIDEAYSCACAHLLSKPDDGHARSILHVYTDGKIPLIALDKKVEAPVRPAPPIRRWEVLGPINVGKLEHDSDSTFIGHHAFPSYSSDLLDVGLYVLGLPSNSSVLSELVQGGSVRWTSVNANEFGEVSYASNLQAVGRTCLTVISVFSGAGKLSIGPLE